MSGTTRRLTEGEAEGSVVHADIGLSFWGGVDPRSGLVVDKRHPLHGRSLAGAVVAIPSGRGSCTASGGANQPAPRACRRVVARFGAVS